MPAKKSTRKTAKKSTKKSSKRASRESPSAKASFEVYMDKNTSTKIGERMDKKNCHSKCATGGGFYFLGFIGAVIYYLSIATGFWMGVLGILKALVWPAILVFKLLLMLG